MISAEHKELIGPSGLFLAAEMAAPAIQEGFLCPICMKDLGGVAELQGHFEEEHSSEDKAVLQQLKGLFGKAKRKILGKEREEDGTMGMFADDSESPYDSTRDHVLGGIDPAMWEPQELGATQSHTASFKRVRDARLDRFVVETNKLLIRLDKLISPDLPSEPNKRKAFEKSIVSWAPDSDVNICTTCGRSFNITRRRHHCRLCGGIICNKCSQFLPFYYAKKLTNPGFRYEGEGFHRSSSNSSLNSIMSPEGEMHIRTCSECRVLLERRDQQMEQRNSKPPIVQIYERMHSYIEEAEQALPTFIQMVESLSAGETNYNLRDAQILRMKVVKLYESIDALSKRIAALGLDAPDPPPPRALKLQRAIRSHAAHFLQFNLMGLQSLPSEEQLVQLQETRRQEKLRQIEAEKRAAEERERKHREEAQKRQAADGAERKPEESPSPSNPSPSKVPSKPGLKRPTNLNRQLAARTTGWKPVEVSLRSTEDDPMVQQINIIRGYVKQAKQAQKWDEVQMLEQNLKELQMAYWEQMKDHEQVKQQQSNGNAGNPFL